MLEETPSYIPANLHQLDLILSVDLETLYPNTRFVFFLTNSLLDSGLRQERPPHLRVDGIHPAMRERGRAIPATSTVPIVTEDKPVPPTAPRIVEGRVSIFGRKITFLIGFDWPIIFPLFKILQPGPIPGMPGMRPPMGAGSNHQANHKGNSLGFIMPLYTVGIVAFFVYTIMKVRWPLYSV